MRKKAGTLYIATIGIVFIALVGIMLYFIFSKQSNHIKIPQPAYNMTQQVSPSSPPSAASTTKVLEYPPLYPQVQWEQPTRIKMGIVTQSSSNGIESNTVVANKIQSILLHQNPLDNKGFWDYYSNALKKRGWVEYKLNDSVGPQGAILFWTNNGHYFGVGHMQVFNGSPQSDMYGKPINFVGYRVFVEYN